MRVLPILFNTEMVQAILDGRKTVTRRVVKPQILDHCPNCMHMHNDFIYDVNAQNVYCASCGEPLDQDGISYKAPYHPRDILYVRETWAPYCINKKHCSNVLLGHGDFCYKATKEDDCVNSLGCKWHPSIHMPKEAARIWLKVTDVKVGRLQEIKDEQAEKEGCSDHTSTALGFCYIWDSTIRKTDLDRYGWDANPWVWVIEFERCEKPADI